MGATLPVLVGSPAVHAANVHSMVARAKSAVPRKVNVSRLPAAAAASQSAVQLPFHPRSAAGFKAAKSGAASGKTGRRSGVITLPPAAPVASGSPGVATASSGKNLVVGTSFTLTDRDAQVSWYGSANQNVAPPDTQLGAGPDNLVEMVNSSGSIWSKAGTLQSHFDLYPFFGVTGSGSFSDPRVQYDDSSGVWFASGLTFGFSPTHSTIELAVSTSDNPAGTWTLYDVSVLSSGIQDQPKFGITSDKLIMTWNDFNDSNIFQGQETVVIQKSDLVAGLQFHADSMFAGPDGSRFNLIPAQEATVVSTGYLVHNLFDSSGNSIGQAGVITITGTPLANNVTWAEEDAAIWPTHMPPGATQGSLGPLLATNDDAFVTAAVKDQILWVAGNDSCTDGSEQFARPCVRAIQLSLSGSLGVLQDVDLVRGGGAMFFPALALDPDGNMVLGFNSSDDSGSGAGVSVTGQPAVGPGSFATPRLIKAGDGAYSCGSSCGTGFNGNRWGDYSGVARDPVTNDIWIAGEFGTTVPPSPTVFTSSDWGTAAGSVHFASSALRTAFSNLQYQLANSNGSSWIGIDPSRLLLTVQPAVSNQAVVDANADLWTATAGVNQDLAIFVSDNGGPASLLAWKESGGKAGTFSPNAAFVHAVMAVTANHQYTFSLRWKSNVGVSGSIIFAGAGTGPIFSPTRLTVRTVEAGSSLLTRVSTKQYPLATSSSTTWTAMDKGTGGLFIDVPPNANAVAIVHGNADLWTVTPGINQDIGFQASGGNFVTPQVVAWKESGGRSGTFSPNAAFVQTVISNAYVSQGFRITLVWKPNVAAAGGSIRAGAGVGPTFSPTRLTVELVPAGTVYTAVSPQTQQYALGANDGHNWWLMDDITFHLSFTALSDCLAVIGANADLWTENSGVNQDIGIQAAYRNNNAAYTYAPDVIGWKESGGSGGTFSPNAAFLETVWPIYNGLQYDFRLDWKANHQTAGTIHANAGVSANFSPTRLTVQLICS
jgi:hypothetical protein